MFLFINSSTGGGFTTAVRFNSSNETEAETEKADVKAAVSALWGTKASMQEALTKLTTLQSKEIRIVSKGDVDAVPTMESLIEVVTKFPTKVASGTGKDAVASTLVRPCSTVASFRQR